MRRHPDRDRGRAAPSPFDVAVPVPAWRVVRLWLAVVMLGFAVVGTIDVVAAGSPGIGEVALLVGGLAALLWIQVGYFARPRAQLDRRISWALLGVQAVVTHGMQEILGDGFAAFTGFLAGSALLVLPARMGWVIYLAVVALTLVRVSAGPVLPGTTVGPVVVLYTTIGAALTGLIVYGLTRLAQLVVDLQEARAEQAAAAAREERLTLAADLRSLIGARLTEIATSAEQAIAALHRPAGGPGRRLAGELERILILARGALLDARSVASRYRTLSLSAELRSTTAVLQRAGIAASIHNGLVGELLPEVETVLAMGLREGVTHLIRAGSAAVGVVELSQQDGTVRLHVRDGRLPAPIPDTAAPAADSWIRGRVGRVGGRMDGWTGPDRTVRMVLEVPRTDDTPPATDDRAGRGVAGCVAQALGRRVNELIVVVVFASYAVGAATRASAQPYDTAARIVTTTGLVVIVALQLLLLSRLARSEAGRRWIWGGQALVMLVPLALPAAPLWISLPGVVAGTALLVWPPVFGAALFAAIVTGTGLITSLGYGSGGFETVFLVVTTLNSGLATWGLVLLIWLGRDLDAGRAEAARSAALGARLRVLRDLHDLLGLNLSAVTLKGEVAHRLVDVDTGGLIVELVEIRAIAGAATEDLAALTHGGATVSIASELATISSILRAAGIELTTQIHTAGLPPAVDEVLAAALREGVTNLLRHSKAEHCSITLHRGGQGQMLFELVNDGVGDAVPAPDTRRATPGRPQVGGLGLPNLRERVTELGGTLETVHDDNGATFRLRLRLPVS